MRQARAICLILKVREVDMLNEAGKSHDNAITTWHRESRGNRPTKDQNEYEALVKCHGNTIQWTPTP